jgi:membrane-bound serine protease (ClpP class)
MAPGTNLGAATPIPVMSPGSPDDPADMQKPKPGDKAPQPGKEPSGAAERKIVHDAVAYIRSLAEMRGRNADWAEQAVRQGVSLSAEQAKEQDVIEVIASDTSELLKALDGRKITLANSPLTLKTGGMEVTKIEPDWRTAILAVLTNPTVAYILMLIGIYGLLLEGYHPGAILPGVVGAICLLMALYAFQILPINYAGLGLILLGIVLIVAETFVPSFGIMGIGGVIAFVVGSIMLFDSDVPGYDIPIAIIAAIATAASGLLLLIVVMLMRSRQRAVVTGSEAMTQEIAEALESFEREGWVQVRGESWRARSSRPVSKGQRVRVKGMEGLTLTVEPERAS